MLLPGSVLKTANASQIVFKQKLGIEKMDER
jgi:hypothetical protein